MVSNSDPRIQRISQDICDAQCVCLFRDSAQLLGQLPHSGIGGFLAKSTPFDLNSFAPENLSENRKTSVQTSFSNKPLTMQRAVAWNILYSSMKMAFYSAIAIYPAIRSSWSLPAGL